MLSNKSLILLDRDGCLNTKAPVDEYVDDASGVELNRGAISFIRELSARKFKFAVITNQRGISLGLYTMDVVKQIHEKIAKEAGLPSELIKLYVCPHEEDSCDCRKPSPKLLEIAIADAGVEKEEAVFIGDQNSDAEAAFRAGVFFLAYKFHPMRLNDQWKRFDSFIELQSEFLKRC